MPNSAIGRIPALVALLIGTCVCLSPVTSPALIIVPGDSAVWRFEDPGPLTPPYSFVDIQFTQVDFGLIQPTGVEVRFFDDSPAGQPEDQLFSGTNFAGILTLSAILGPSHTSLLDDSVFYLKLTNSGNFAISLPEIQMGRFFVGQYLQNGDTVLAAPIPEPGTLVLLGSGLLGLVGYGRKKFFKNKSTQI